MSAHRWDTAIVGGGVAGSAAAANLARRGLRVGLIEQGRFDKPRVGEVVPYSLLKWLRDHLALDLFEAPEVPRFPVQFRVLWGSDTAARDSLHLPTHVRIDRRALDRCLFEHASRVGAEAFEGSRVWSAKRTSRDWEICFHHNGMIHVALARFVIEATGRTRYSPVTIDRRRLFEDAQIACAIRIASKEGNWLDNQVWIESHEEGWFYVSELPNAECLVVFFTDRDLMPSQAAARNHWIEKQWLKTRACKGCFDGIGLRKFGHSAWSRHDARMSLRRMCFGPGWMAIGDAQMALDPLSGQGIAESLRGAIAASEFLAETNEWDKLDWMVWAQSIASRYHQHRLQRVDQYRRETAFAESIFWKRRCRFDFDDFDDTLSHSKHFTALQS